MRMDSVPKDIKIIMKRALIIGVTGQDGPYLAKLLLDKGYEVHGTSRDHESSSFANLDRLGIKERITPHSLISRDFRSVLATLQAVQPDEIYNLSGQSSVALSFLQPVETFESISVATVNVLECLRMFNHPAKFYNAGSSEVFGNAPSAASEQTLFCPRSPYATAKAAAHYTVANYREAYGLKACTGILFNHESPLRSARFVTRKIVSAAVRISRGSSEILELGNVRARRDWGWAPEYVEAMWLMLQQDDCDDYVVATGETNGLDDFTDAVFKAVDLDWREHVKYNNTLLRPSDIDVSSADPGKAATKLGWAAKYRMRDVARLLVDAELAGVD